MSWVHTKFATALKFYNGKAGTVNESGAYPVYGSNGIIGYCEEPLFENAIIIGRVGAYCGAIQYCKGKFWASDNTIVVKANTGYDVVFLSYLLHIMNLNQFAGGSAQPLLTHGWIKPIAVKMPPLPIQQKIAGILAAYDDLIENNLKRIKLLEEMAHITYEEWFVRLRFPGYESKPITPETGLPEGWKIKKLGEVTALIKRGISPQYVESGGLTVINQKCVRNHNVNLEVARQTTLSKKVPPEKMLKKYDVLINSTGTGTLGRVAQYFFDTSPATVDTHVTIVRAPEGISSLYLGRFLERNEPYLEQLGKGATNQKELSATDISNAVEIVVPDQDIQEKYHDYCDCIFADVTALNAQNILLREARDILLPRLMTGVIDVESYDPAQLLKEAA